MLPLVSARTEDFRLSLKKAPLAPTYDLHVEYDHELLGGVMKRSMLFQTPPVRLASPSLILPSGQVNFRCSHENILQVPPLEKNGDSRVYFEEFHESCRVIDEGTLPLKLPTQGLCEVELEISTSIDKLYASGSYYSCVSSLSDGTQQSKRGQEMCPSRRRSCVVVTKASAVH